MSAHTMNDELMNGVCLSAEVKHLRKEDVPGATLAKRDQSTLKIPELKRWLLCRCASIREARKADIVLL